MPQESIQDQRLDDAHLRRLIDALPSVISIFDLVEQRCTYINRSVTALLGYAPEEVMALGAGMLDALMHPDDLVRFRAHLQSLHTLRDGESKGFAHRMRHRSGRWVWFQSRDAVYARDASGAVRQIVSDSLALSDSPWNDAAVHLPDDLGTVIFESSSDCVKLLTKDGTLLAMNRNGQCLMEIDDVGAVLGQHWHTLWPESGRQQIREAIDNAARQQETRFEAFCPTGKGTPKWWDVVVAPVCDEAGDVQVVVATSRDITARRHADETLRRNHDTFHHLIANNPFGIYVVDADFNLVQVSAGAQKVFSGVQPLLGRNFGDVIRIIWPEPFATQVIQTFRHTLSTGEPYVATSTVEQRANIDAVEAYDWRIERIALPDGRWGVVCYFYDLTERRAFEEALRTSETRLRLGMQVAGIGISEVDYRADVHLLSAETAHLYGLGESARVVPRGDVHAIIHPDDRDRVMTTNAAAIDPASDGRVAMDHRIVWPDGQTRWVQVRKQVFFEGEGAQRHAVRATLATIDITEARVAQEKLRQLAEQLSDADRRKDEFLAMLAHELRNPLAAINGALQWLHRAQSSADSPAAPAALSEDVVRHARDVLSRQTRQLNRLVEDLMDVNRISRGKIDLRRGVVDLVTVVRQAVESAQPLLDCLAHRLEVCLPEAPIYCDGDDARLVQIVGNLLNNACKFTDRGGTIRVSLERAAEGSNEVALRVRDNGVGIARDQLESIFDLFRQVDTSLNRTQSGLGIGLSLVKTLAEMHGGRVEARSEGVGRGSEFVLHLPVRAATTPVDAATAAPPQRAAATRRRVLIVDDNVDAAQMLAMLLQLDGHDTEVVHDGQAAVERALATSPEVILLDLGLPKLNGHEACRQIRQKLCASVERRGPLIVALTGWSQDHDRQETRQSGFDAHLVKPVEIEQLTALLEEV